MEARYQDSHHKALIYILGISEDTRNHFSQIYDISTLLDAAGEEDSSMVMATLEELLDDIRLAEDIIYSANPVLNSILKVKAAKARENRIKMDIITLIPKKIDIETGDMGVLYGNLLDNAIEACYQTGQEERFLDLETKYQDGNLLILVRNSKTGKEKKGLSQRNQIKGNMAGESELSAGWRRSMGEPFFWKTGAVYLRQNSC